MKFLFVCSLSQKQTHTHKPHKPKKQKKDNDLPQMKTPDYDTVIQTFTVEVKWVTEAEQEAGTNESLQTWHSCLISF